MNEKPERSPKFQKSILVTLQSNDFISLTNVLALITTKLKQITNLQENKPDETYVWIRTIGKEK